jgi:hypothetical protein
MEAAPSRASEPTRVAREAREQTRTFSFDWLELRICEWSKSKLLLDVTASAVSGFLNFKTQSDDRIGPIFNDARGSEAFNGQKLFWVFADKLEHGNLAFSDSHCSRLTHRLAV